MAPTPTAGLILAAGKGTRMKSDLPKVLHEVAGTPMVRLVVAALAEAGVREPVVVTGYGGELVRESLAPDGCQFVEQAEQKGTGHAALMAAPVLGEFEGPVVVAAGDTPLLTSGTVRGLVEEFLGSGAQAVVASFVTFEPKGYGRIVRDGDVRVVGIVEEKDATPEQRRIQEVNAGLYCFDSATLFRILPTLGTDNAQGEVYLTDVVAAIAAEGGLVTAMTADDPDEFMGVNDRWQLAEASRVMRLRVLRRHAMNGVTIVDPTSTYIGAEVVIEPDVTIQPMTVLEGRTEVETGAAIGPNAWVKDSVIGRGCRVFMSHIDQAVMEAESRCGPFSNLRPGTRLGRKAKVGNFVEVKNSDIGESTAVSHLTYIGDSTVGARTNIGAGTITCNYDGFEKHRTTIGDDAFVGSNSTLIAPRRIGDGAMVAAGSVVHEDVPDDALAIGRAKQENKEQWVASWRERRSGQRDEKANSRP